MAGKALSALPCPASASSQDCTSQAQSVPRALMPCSTLPPLIQSMLCNSCVTRRGSFLLKPPWIVSASLSPVPGDALLCSALGAAMWAPRFCSWGNPASLPGAAQWEMPQVQLPVLWENTGTALPRAREGEGIFYFWFRADKSSTNKHLNWLLLHILHLAPWAGGDELLFPPSALKAAADFRFIYWKVSFTVVICLILLRLWSDIWSLLDSTLHVSIKILSA